MLKIQDVGVLAYGGGVTGLAAWDQSRIDKGELAEKDIWKKGSTYGYLVPGAVALTASAFGFWRQAEPWMETISHGFIYGFPGFLKDVVNSMSGGSTGSRAIAQAQQVARAHQTRALPAAGQTARSYQPEFDKAALF